MVFPVHAQGKVAHRLVLEPSHDDAVELGAGKAVLQHEARVRVLWDRLDDPERPAHIPAGVPEVVHGHPQADVGLDVNRSLELAHVCQLVCHALAVLAAAYQGVKLGAVVPLLQFRYDLLERPGLRGEKPYGAAFDDLLVGYPGGLGRERGLPRLHASSLPRAGSPSESNHFGSRSRAAMTGNPS